MAGPKRWPPLLIPQLPRVWIRTGVVLALIGSALMAGDTLPGTCGFGDQLCHPLLSTLGSLTTTIFWFWLIAPCVIFALGIVHVARVTISWLRLDVVRPRRT
jgi:hypothetical protein